MLLWPHKPSIVRKLEKRPQSDPFSHRQNLKNPESNGKSRRRSVLPQGIRELAAFDFREPERAIEDRECKGWFYNKRPRGAHERDKFCVFRPCEPFDNKHWFRRDFAYFVGNSWDFQDSAPSNQHRLWERGDVRLFFGAPQPHHHGPKLPLSVHLELRVLQARRHFASPSKRGASVALCRRVSFSTHSPHKLAKLFIFLDPAQTLQQSRAQFVDADQFTPKSPFEKQFFKRTSQDHFSRLNLAKRPLL